MTADAAEIVRLAERVERATGPDRELDAAVWLHLPEQEGHAWKHDGDRHKHARQIAGASWVPFYTFTVDAAKSLVPAGVSWGVGFVNDPISGKEYWAGVGDQPRPSLAASAASALTAAALRARAAQHDHEVG